MPLNYFLENKLTLYKAPYNISDNTIDNWTMWQFQSNIENINKRNSKMDSIVDNEKALNMLGK